MTSNPMLYRAARPTLRPGDVILYRPGRREWLNRRIAATAVHSQAAPWQRYAHAGLVGWAQGVCELLEMLQFREGRATRLSWQVRGWSGQWDVYRPHVDEFFEERLDFKHEHARLTVPRGEEASRVMRLMTGTPYGWGSIWRASAGYLPLMSLFCGVPADDQADGRIESARHCSQAVAFCWRRAGSDPIEHLSDSVTTPNHLAWPEWSRYVCTLVW